MAISKRTCASCGVKKPYPGAGGGFMTCGAWRSQFLCDDCIGEHYPLPSL